MRERASGRLWKLSLSCSLALSLVSGCASKPQIVVNQTFDFSKVHRISVVPLDGPGGPEATDALVKELVGTGIEVTDANHPGDLILKGSVTEYKPAMQLMVFLGNDDTVLAAGAQLTPDALAAGAHKPEIASVTAVVAVQAHVEDSSHRIVWANSYSYEGVDLPSALGPVADVLVRSLQRLVPQMNRPKPS